MFKQTAQTPFIYFQFYVMKHFLKKILAFAACSLMTYGLLLMVWGYMPQTAAEKTLTIKSVRRSHLHPTGVEAFNQELIEALRNKGHLES